MSYSIDFRRKVISTRKNEGLSIRETAKQFRIGPASVSRWINQIESKASTTRQRKIDIAKRHYFDNSQLCFFATYQGIGCNHF
ncbi:IS630 transposase-related protein [Symbiopectobacterium purcellii]|uniref:IS630 transposase-related protein n=1 Tax=Symbiopectobacterium purcellii TaxID=2871826 RepID=UPI003F848FA8